MLALNETARLYRHLGRQNGAPGFVTSGVAFPCRTESEAGQTPGSRGLSGGERVRVFARPLDAAPGDRLVLEDGRTLTVTEVKAVRGFSGLHHLELVAASEG